MTLHTVESYNPPGYRPISLETKYLLVIRPPDVSPLKTPHEVVSRNLVQSNPFCFNKQTKAVINRVITWDRYESNKWLHETGMNSDQYELGPVRTRTGAESLHETGMKVTRDYMRPVWTQTGTIIQRLLCACLKRKSQTSLKSVCDYMGKTAEPVWLIRVSSAPGMSQTGLRWFFEPVSCKQKQGVCTGLM